MNSKRGFVFTVLAASLILMLALGTGCASKKQPKITPTPGPAVEQQGSGDGQPDIDVTSKMWVPFEGLSTVHFDYNKYDLRADTRAKLNKNAELIKAQPDVLVQIEGHCDERGTQEYNLALGEKRALAVRDYLVKLGISGDRIVTISYGEEKPVDGGHDEAAWSKNRRCEFNKAAR